MINISVIFPTRGRHNRILKSLCTLRDKAVLKDQIEYLAWVDSDDKHTIRVVKDLKKQFPNLRLFVCPRVGFGNIWFMYDHMIKESRGEILLPWADDCEMTQKKWDKKMIEFMDEVAIIGFRTRFGFTKSLLREHDIINDIMKKDPQYFNELVRDYAKENDLYRFMKKRWFKVNVPRKVERIKIKKENLPDNFDIKLYEVKG